MSGGDDNDDDGFQMMTTRGSQKTNDAKKKNGRNQNHRQQRSSNNYTGKRQPNKNKTKKKNNFSAGPTLSARGWSKPTTGWDDNNNEVDMMPDEPESYVGTEPIDTTGGDPVASETAAAVDEKINRALVSSTTVSATMGSLMASMGFAAKTATPKASNNNNNNNTQSMVKDFSSFAKGQTMEELLGDLGERDPNWKEKQFPSFSDDHHEPNISAEPKPEEPTTTGFAAFCKEQSTSGLLSDFGQADPHWKERVVVVDDEEEEGKESTTTNGKAASKPTSSKPKYSHSRLAIRGKAAIHLSIESFGVVHGVPSRGARDRSGSPYTQPLEWLGVGDEITEPVPNHLEFHDGIRSGVVKRLLKTVPMIEERGNDDDDDDDTSVDSSHTSSFASYCKFHLAETKIFPSLLEAIHEGGHGYVSPLQMKISIGSTLGRHRSVVATEWIAQHLRHLLRTHNQKIAASTKNNNKTEYKAYKPRDNRPITCSVSVGTFHRDVNKRIPHKHYKEDHEDYVDKKDRF